MTTIRAYGDSARFTSSCLALIDANNGPFLLLWMANRVLSVLCDSAGALVAVVAAVLIIQSPGLGAGVAGLSLSYSITFTDSVLVRIPSVAFYRPQNALLTLLLTLPFLFLILSLILISGSFVSILHGRYRSTRSSAWASTSTSPSRRTSTPKGSSRPRTGRRARVGSRSRASSLDTLLR